MADEVVYKALDATDATQVIAALTSWINGLGILPDTLHIEYVPDSHSLGFCIKSAGGYVIDEDIIGDFSAEVPFEIYYTTNAVPDGAAAIYEPLNDLSAWFRANGTTGLDLGDRRTPDEIITTRGPTDQSGQDEDGNVTFFSSFSLTYDEEAS